MAKYHTNQSRQKIYTRKEILIDNTKNIIDPNELAGDLYRLICVLNIAYGIEANKDIKNKAELKNTKIVLHYTERNDFNQLMFDRNSDVINGGFDLNACFVMQKLSTSNSEGRLINWRKVWEHSSLFLNVEQLLK